MTAGRPLRPALFLDRDGVINVDHGYVHRVEQFEFLPGIFDLARVATRRGWPVVVVTNQAGIGRGYYGEAEFATLTAWMRERFEAAGAPVTAVYHCPSHPTEALGVHRIDSPWRKPAPGMLLQAAADHAIDLPRSVLVGDKASDVQAGRAAGLRLNLLLDAGAAPGDPERVATLADAAARVEAHWPAPADGPAGGTVDAPLGGTADAGAAR